MRSPSFAPFQVRSFRFQWPADLAMSWAFEMETLVLGWYVLVETGSVSLLALFGALQFFGALVSPLLGVAGDRIGHRRLLCITRSSYVVMAAFLMVLAFTGGLTPAIVLAVTAVAGLIRPSDMMMRNTIIAQTMTPALLIGALGLSRVTTDSSRIAGALAGAGVVAAFGIGPAYALILCLYGLSFGLSFGIARVRRPAASSPTHAAPSPWNDLRHLFVYVWRKPELLAATAIAFLGNLLAYPFVLGLLPYAAREIYQVGQIGLGVLAATFAAGCLAGSIFVILNRTPLRLARTMLAGAAIWFLLILVFVHLRSVAAGAIVLALAGFAQTMCMVPLAAVMLRNSGEEIRGRVMGIRMLAVGGMPLGLLLAGPLIGHIGFAATGSLYALLGLAFTLWIAMHWRQHLWRIGAPANRRM